MSPVEDASAAGVLPADAIIVARLRDRDEPMFVTLVEAWSPGMLRTARAYVADEHAAPDVVQEAWLGVLRGIGGFQERSSLRTWVYRIVINRAKTRGVRDARTVPASSLAPIDEDFGPTVDLARFRGPDDLYPGHWRSQPPAWPSPEDGAVATETRRQLIAALAGLPTRQRIVVTLRDAEGYTSDEVCDQLSISATNQRVLLHRGRAALAHQPRGALEDRGRPMNGEASVGMNCDEFVELVTAYLDGALEPATEQRFTDHVAECDGCNRYLDQIRTTIEVLGHLTAQNLPTEAKENLLAAFRDWPVD